MSNLDKSKEWEIQHHSKINSALKTKTNHAGILAPPFSVIRLFGADGKINRVHGMPISRAISLPKRMRKLPPNKNFKKNLHPAPESPSPVLSLNMQVTETHSRTMQKNNTCAVCLRRMLHVEIRRIPTVRHSKEKQERQEEQNFRIGDGNRKTCQKNRERTT